MGTKERRPSKIVPLNCVDKCELALDSIGERALIHAFVELEGEVDDVRLNRAIMSAQETYPVMRTLLRSKYFRHFREIQDNLGEGVLSVQDLSQLKDIGYEKYLWQWMNQPMDLRKRFPVRALLLKKNVVESCLVFAFHHSSTDGIRAVVFMKQVFDNCNNALSAEDSKATQDIRMSLKGDALLKFANRERNRTEHFYIKMFLSLFHRFILAIYPPPTRVFHDKSGHSKEVHQCYEIIDSEAMRSIESKASSVGVEIHDILLAACYRAIERWNSRHGKTSNKIRIMAPVNISPKGFRNIVANQASWVSPVTYPKDRVDPVKLLKKVRADNIYATQNRIAFSLVYFFYFCSCFPLAFMKMICRFLMITRTYVDSILITNMGVLWPKVGADEPAVTSIGSAKIINVIGSAPVVTPMGLSICVGIYNRNLSISLTYRPALFSREKAKSFLKLYVEEIQNYRVGPEAS
ncbi:MAG TPA: condensation domain-containing protein [Dehalococcoidia bacterium]|nr:condensation domain-containing protein [Dehalococcoidia bacterium]